MEVTNKTTFKLGAYCWDTRYGYGTPEVILPGETVELKGPLVIETINGKGYLAFPCKINCQETPDNENGYQVTPETPLILQSEEKGVTVEFTTADMIVL